MNWLMRAVTVLKLVASATVHMKTILISAFACVLVAFAGREWLKAA